jgi:hypothetical protein
MLEAMCRYCVRKDVSARPAKFNTDISFQILFMSSEQIKTLKEE